MTNQGNDISAANGGGVRDPRNGGGTSPNGIAIGLGVAKGGGSSIAAGSSPGFAGGIERGNFAFGSGFGVARNIS